MAASHKDGYKKLMSDIGKMYKRCPGIAEGFGKLHDKAMKGGVVSTKDKELIALGIAVAVRCTGCITSHVKGAIDAGATREEIYETVGVAVLMAGGPGAVYGSMAIEATEEFLGA